MMERKRSKETINKSPKIISVFSTIKKGTSREFAQKSRIRKISRMGLQQLLRKKGMSQLGYVWLQNMCQQVPGF